MRSLVNSTEKCQLQIDYKMILVGLTCLILCCSGSAQVYSVRGHVRYDALPEGKAFHEYDYTVAVSNCDWAIDLRTTSWGPIPTNRPKTIPLKLDNGTVMQLPVRPPSDSPTHFRHMFNGTQVVFTAYLPHPLFNTNGIVVQESEGSLKVERDDLPDGGADGGVAATLWLAYASQCYMDRTHNGWLKPVSPLDPKMRRAKFTTPADVLRSGGSKGLPKIVTYYFDETAWNTSSRVKAPARANAGPADKDEKILWAEYSAPDFTNADGISVPSAFELTGFEAFRELIKPGERLPVCRITGVTHDVSGTVDGALLDPIFKGVAYVEDLRVSSKGGSVNYYVTNSGPLSLESTGIP